LQTNLAVLFGKFPENILYIGVERVHRLRCAVIKHAITFPAAALRQQTGDDQTALSVVGTQNCYSMVESNPVQLIE
jgi:hypothetical protein